MHASIAFLGVAPILLLMDAVNADPIPPQEIVDKLVKFRVEDQSDCRYYLPQVAKKLKEPVYPAKKLVAFAVHYFQECSKLRNDGFHKESEANQFDILRQVMINAALNDGNAKSVFGPSPEDFTELEAIITSYPELMPMSDNDCDSLNHFRQKVHQNHISTDPALAEQASDLFAKYAFTNLALRMHKFEPEAADIRFGNVQYNHFVAALLLTKNTNDNGSFHDFTTDKTKLEAFAKAHGLQRSFTIINSLEQEIMQFAKKLVKAKIEIKLPECLFLFHRFVLDSAVGIIRQKAQDIKQCVKDKTQLKPHNDKYEATYPSIVTQIQSHYDSGLTQDPFVDLGQMINRKLSFFLARELFAKNQVLIMDIKSKKAPIKTITNTESGFPIVPFLGGAGLGLVAGGIGGGVGVHVAHQKGLIGNCKECTPNEPSKAPPTEKPSGMHPLWIVLIVVFVIVVIGIGGWGTYHYLIKPANSDSAKSKSKDGDGGDKTGKSAGKDKSAKSEASKTQRSGSAIPDKNSSSGATHTGSSAQSNTSAKTSGTSKSAGNSSQA